MVDWCLQKKSSNQNNKEIKSLTMFTPTEGDSKHTRDTCTEDINGKVGTWKAQRANQSHLQKSLLLELYDLTLKDAVKTILWNLNPANDMPPYLSGIFSLGCWSTITTSRLVHTRLSSSIIRLASTSASDSTKLGRRNTNWTLISIHLIFFAQMQESRENQQGWQW